VLTRKAKSALRSGSDTVQRLGKVAGKSAKLAAAAGSAAAVKGWKETSAASRKRRKRVKVAAAVAGVAAATAAGVALYRSRTRSTTSNGALPGTTRSKKSGA
jgi:hypothetical protein